MKNIYNIIPSQDQNLGQNLDPVNLTPELTDSSDQNIIPQVPTIQYGSNELLKQKVSETGCQALGTIDVCGECVKFILPMCVQLKSNGDTI